MGLRKYEPSNDPEPDQDPSWWKWLWKLLIALIALEYSSLVIDIAIVVIMFIWAYLCGKLMF